jgi:hypothetical protein
MAYKKGLGAAPVRMQPENQTANTNDKLAIVQLILEFSRYIKLLLANFARPFKVVV